MLLIVQEIAFCFFQWLLLDYSLEIIFQQLISYHMHLVLRNYQQMKQFVMDLSYFA